MKISSIFLKEKEKKSFLFKNERNGIKEKEGKMKFNLFFVYPSILLHLQNKTQLNGEGRMKRKKEEKKIQDKETKIKLDKKRRKKSST